MFASSLSCGQHSLSAIEFAHALAISVCWGFAPALCLASRSYDSGCVPRGPLLQECYLPSLLLRPHVPVHLPLITFAFTLGDESLPLRPPTAGQWTFPALGLANLSLDAPSPTPAAPEVLAPVSSLWTSAFPEKSTGRRLAFTRAAISARRIISGLQTFLDVKASSFACHPGRSHRSGAFLCGPSPRLRKRVSSFALSIAKWGHNSSLVCS